MKYTTFNTMKRIKLFLSVAVLISIIGCKEEVDTSLCLQGRDHFKLFGET